MLRSPVSGPLNSAANHFFSRTQRWTAGHGRNPALFSELRISPWKCRSRAAPTAPLRVSISGMRMLDISPDASEMLALKPDMNDESGRGSIWSVPVLGGYPKMVGSRIAQDARWSPDGRSIVYVDLNSVYVSDRDGANLKKIWDAPERRRLAVFFPRFPPYSRERPRRQASFLRLRFGN